LPHAAESFFFLRTLRKKEARSARGGGSRGNGMFPCLRQACPLRTAAVLFFAVLTQTGARSARARGSRGNGMFPCLRQACPLRTAAVLFLAVLTQTGARSARARGSRGNAMFPLRPSGLPIPHRPGAAAPDPGVGHSLRLPWIKSVPLSPFMLQLHISSYESS